jgi:hypothetical protein
MSDFSYIEAHFTMQITVRWIFLVSFLLAGHLGVSQSTYYVQIGSTLSKVTDGDPSAVKASEWQVRLYKANAASEGSGYWGLISGQSASEVMNALAERQKFELDYNQFMGNGNVQDETYTNFNPLGPIAVLQKGPLSSRLTEMQQKIKQIYERFIDTYETFLEVKNYLDVAIKGQDNPYADVGSNFKAYTDLLKDRAIEIRQMQVIQDEATDKEMDGIAAKLKSIDQGLLNIENTLKASRSKDTDEIDSALSKALAKVSQSKNANADSTNSFYVYLTAIIIFPPDQSTLFSNLKDPKPINVISSRIWYTRGQTDEALIKDNFISEMIRQIPNLPDGFRKYISANNYENIGYINTNFKQSVPLLTDAQCAEAIQNYKVLTLNIDKSATFKQLQ